MTYAALAGPMAPVSGSTITGAAAVARPLQAAAAITASRAVHCRIRIDGRMAPPS
ncbi:hypothetical protein GCM10009079_38220 [Ralstonia mannitolilytica]